MVLSTLEKAEIYNSTNLGWGTGIYIPHETYLKLALHWPPSVSGPLQSHNLSRPDLQLSNMDNFTYVFYCEQ